MLNSDCIKQYQNLLEQKVMSDSSVRSSSPNSSGDGDDDENNNNSSKSHYEKSNGKLRRRYQRFATDTKKVYSTFGGSHSLLFNKFNRDLIKWPGAIECVDRPTICFSFCDFVIKKKNIPTCFPPLDHPPHIQDYRGLINFLLKRNISPAAFECDGIDSDRFFHMYNNNLQRLRPALVSFCAFLTTFQACERLQAETGFFDLEEIYLCFRVGGTLDKQIMMEEKDFLFESSDDEM